MKKLIPIFMLLLVSCTDDDRSIETLKAHGFTDIRVGGYAMMSCSDDDAFKTKFIAKNPKGVAVEGVVCCGYFKGCTVRF